jgi:hypothetical protein
MPVLPERCPQVKEVSPEELSQFALTASEGLGQIKFSHLYETDPLKISTSDPTALEMDQVIGRIANQFQCRRLAIQAEDWRGLILAQALGAAEVELETGTGELGPRHLGAVHAFNTLANKVSINTFYSEVDWSLIAVQDSVKQARLGGAFEERWQAIPAAAEKLPAVETLWLWIGRSVTPQWQTLEGFKSLQHLNLLLESFDDSDAPQLNGISAETLDAVLGIQDALPGLKTLNGVTLDGGELTAEMFGVESAPTRSELQEEAKKQANASGLRAWVNDVLDGGYGQGGPLDSITGPVVVKGTDDDSSRYGAFGEDYNGIPAAKLCLSKDSCVSLAVVSHRLGAVSGNYTPLGGGGVAFMGNLGETVVQVYNAQTGLVTEPIVVSTTEPPTYAESKAEAVGGPDWDAAYEWIAAHTTG